MAYIYEHWRPDTQECFYVGKGSLRRAHIVWGSARNQHHRRVVEKLRKNGMRVDVKIVEGGLSDEEAYRKERDRIALYGMSNLTNQTMGGDGLRTPTAEVRKKMSYARQATLADPEFRIRHAEGIRAALLRDPDRCKRMGKKRIGTKSHPEAVEKRRAALKGRKRPPHVVDKYRGSANPFYGKKHSAEVLARISAKKSGSKLSEQAKVNMRAAQKVRRQFELLAKSPPKPPEQIMPRKQFRHSPETILKMQAAAKLRGISPATRAAQIKAATGRKRAPFTEQTIARMRIAARSREVARRVARGMA